LFRLFGKLNNFQTVDPKNFNNALLVLIVKYVFDSSLSNLFLRITFFEIYRCKFYSKVFRKKDVWLTL